MEVVVAEEIEQVPAAAAAVELARGLARVDIVLPEELQASMRALLEANLEAVVAARRELPPGVLRALDVAAALQKVPEPGTGAFGQ